MTSSEIIKKLEELEIEINKKKDALFDVGQSNDAKQLYIANLGIRQAKITLSKYV